METVGDNADIKHKTSACREIISGKFCLQVIHFLQTVIKSKKGGRVVVLWKDLRS